MQVEDNPQESLYSKEDKSEYKTHWPWDNYEYKTHWPYPFSLSDNESTIKYTKAVTYKCNFALISCFDFLFKCLYYLHRKS